MVRRLCGIVAALALCGSVAAAAADSRHRKDFQVYQDVAASINHYSQFTIFDDVNAAVRDGVVTLTGDVTMPDKRSDIARRVAKVDGVEDVVNQIKVLPASMTDDSLRYRIARAIYGDPNFWNYGIGPNPPIHIIVDHSHVTLTGVVDNETDRTIARSLAYQFPAESVTNDLETNAEVKDRLERIK
jgi:hyperosmotically inducible periplasmic protein